MTASEGKPKPDSSGKRNAFQICCVKDKFAPNIPIIPDALPASKDWLTSSHSATVWLGNSLPARAIVSFHSWPEALPCRTETNDVVSFF